MELIHIARHSFEVPALGDSELFQVVGFEGVETISQPFQFEIRLISTDPDIAFEAVVNEPATLTMSRGDVPSEINGIVSDFELTRRFGSVDLYTVQYEYRLVLVPQLWRLSLTSQSRIFQQMDAPDIVQSVLDAAGIPFRTHLKERYKRRDYTTQYKESDLAFIQRLLEYEGIWYYFEHESGKDTLVLSDDTSMTQPIPSGEDRDDAGKTDEYISLSETDGMALLDGTEYVYDLVARQRLVTAAVQIKEYDYERPEEELFYESEIDPKVAVGVQSDSLSLDVFNTFQTSEGKHLAKVRNEEIETTRLVMSGGSDCLRFRTGFSFTLEDHYRAALNQKYLLTQVRHIGTQADVEGLASTESLTQKMEEAGTSYSNTFTCVPASAPYRPPRLTPEPKLPGVLTAKVETGGGIYAPVDDQGRYRVRFPFDLGDAGAAQASKPVRLAQPYTGPGYGQHFPVHGDVEMVVACVDGNIDKIIGISTVYNGTQTSPVTSENAAQNVLRSWGQNELTFDDTQGEELVYMFGTKDHAVEITNDQGIAVGNDRSQSVGHDETMSVGRDQKEDIGQNQTCTVGLNQKLTVGVDRQIQVNGSHTENIGVNRSLSVAVASSETVGAAKTVKVGALYKTTVGGAYQVSVGAVSSESVKGAKTISAGGPMSVSVGATYEVSVSADMSWEAGNDGDLKVGKKLFVQAGDDLSIKGGKKMNIEAADQLVLKCGKAQIILKKNGDISIKGKKMDLKASGKMTLKGSQIAEN